MSVATMTSRERVMKLFRGEEIDRVPCFSGMGNVTTEGLNQLGHKFAQVHLNAEQMAETAVTTPKLFGFDSCVLPFDLCVEAEALGAKINTYPHSEDILYPTIKEKVIHRRKNSKETFTEPRNVLILQRKTFWALVLCLWHFLTNLEHRKAV